MRDFTHWANGIFNLIYATDNLIELIVSIVTTIICRCATKPNHLTSLPAHSSHLLHSQLCLEIVPRLEDVTPDVHANPRTCCTLPSVHLSPTQVVWDKATIIFTHADSIQIIRNHTIYYHYPGIPRQCSSNIPFLVSASIYTRFQIPFLVTSTWQLLHEYNR